MDAVKLSYRLLENEPPEPEDVDLEMSDLLANCFQETATFSDTRGREVKVTADVPSPGERKQRFLLHVFSSRWPGELVYDAVSFLSNLDTDLAHPSIRLVRVDKFTGHKTLLSLAEANRLRQWLKDVITRYGFTMVSPQHGFRYLRCTKPHRTGESAEHDESLRGGPLAPLALRESLITELADIYEVAGLRTSLSMEGETGRLVHVWQADCRRADPLTGTASGRAVEAVKFKEKLERQLAEWAQSCGWRMAKLKLSGSLRSGPVMEMELEPVAKPLAESDGAESTFPDDELSDLLRCHDWESRLLTDLRGFHATGVIYYTSGYPQRGLVLVSVHTYFNPENGNFYARFIDFTLNWLRDEAGVKVNNYDSFWAPVRIGVFPGWLVSLTVNGRDFGISPPKRDDRQNERNWKAPAD